MKVSNAKKQMLKKHSHIFHTLSRARKTKRDAILKNAPVTLFKAIKTLHQLLVSGGIPLTNTVREKMGAKHRTLIRKIGQAKDTRRVLLQNGQGLGAILRVVLPIVGKIIGL